MGVFISIGCQRGGHVSHGRTAPAVDQCNKKDLSAPEIASILNEIRWPRFLDRLAKRSLVSWLIMQINGNVRFIATGGTDPIFRPGVINLSLTLFCFHCVLTRARMGS